ncbi:MAG: DUF1624 domain-containing protein [Bacteroidetes bacterium]|nr:DUF1624 domain-containing protein [Bacteroidota bacterium]
MKRIHSIDFTRGLVMVIMALDHVRDMMHVDSVSQSPTNLQTTTPELFFTRWITYLCAPTFVFLSGVSAYISFKRTSDIGAARLFLLSRGIWLIVLEFTVVNFGLWFDFHFSTLIMEVICAIGFGLVVLSLLLKFHPRNIAIAGLIIIFGHNLLQGISFPNNPVLSFFASVLFSLNFFSVTPNFGFLVGYPLIPWLGITLVGYGCGQLFELSPGKRKKIFLQIGGLALLLFVIIRFTNIYGDPIKWSTQKNMIFTFLSFMNFTKYPPSLLFDLATLGITFLTLSFAEGISNRVSKFFIVYGKVPLFYFIVHMYLIHISMFVMLFMQGFGVKDFQFGPLQFGRPAAPSGIGLPAIYAVWIAVILVLYPLCKWYGKYKQQHRDNKWLRYL